MITIDMKFSKDLIYLNKDFSDRKEMFTNIGEVLIEKDIVKPAYIEEILKREENFPTGIELEFMSVAMPHVEAKHVNENTMFVVTSAKGVEFDNAEDDGVVNAKIIFGLIVKDSEKHIDFLIKLTELFQKKEVLEKIYSSSNEEEVVALLKENLN